MHIKSKWSLFPTYVQQDVHWSLVIFSNVIRLHP